MKVFNATDTTFTTNGNIVIKPLKAKVHRELIEYYVDIEIPIEYIDYIEQGKIVVVDVGNGNEQAFRVNNITKTGKKISARCKHVFFDSQSHFYVDEGVPVSGTSPHNTMSLVDDYCRPSSPFSYTSDIYTTQKTVLAWFETLYDAIVQVADAFGCAFYPDNYTVHYVSSIGSDKGVVIQYGKNIKDISCEEDWSEVCSRIYPFGADGITVAQTAVGLAVPYIDGEYYPRKYIKAIEFDQSNIKRSDYQTETAYKQALVTDLIAKGQAYLADHGLPKVTYTLKAALAEMEKVGIGDTIVVMDERLGLELETHVTAYDYDCLTGRYTDIVFGNYSKTAKGMGLTVSSVAANQQNGILASKRVLFNDDNTISWEYITPQP